MKNIESYIEYGITNPIKAIGIMILIIFLVLKITKPRMPRKTFLVLLVATIIILTIIIFAIMIIKYNDAVMPNELKTDEIYSLEKSLNEEYKEVDKLEVKEVGGVELSITVLLNENVDENLSKEILNKIRNVLIGKEFENDIQNYYWRKYYIQFSFEVKYMIREEILFTFSTHRSANDNANLTEWNSYSYYTKEQDKIMLK
ncbi:hypothetical protein [Fusibacter bizertensis]